LPLVLETEPFSRYGIIMRMHLWVVPAIFALLATQGCSTATRENPPEKRHYLFSYFTGQTDGARLAVSDDGKSWHPVNGGRPIIQPDSGDVLRDPAIHRGPDGVYRMVWTTGWTGREIGFSTSTDLVHWAPARKLGVMAGGPNVGHCWAPEIFYDQKAREYIIHWSSDSDVWSIFYVTTTDFLSFSEPRVLFTNGQRGGGKGGDNGPIDAHIFEKSADEFILYYKKDDNTGVPNIYWRVGQSPRGPWGSEQGPVTPSTGDEGPSVVRMGRSFAMFTDPFESDKAYLFTSTDLKHWERQSTDLTMSHGSVVEIDKATWRRLRELR
jgi:beta-galactosidase